MGGGRWSALSGLQTLIGLGLVFSAFCLYGSAFVATPSLVLAVICTIAGRFLVTLLHEAGHATAALLCGWRVLVFVVRPFCLHVPTRTIVTVPREYGLRSQGFVVFVPRALKNGTRRRWMFAVASGPGACLALTTGALALYPWARPFDTPDFISSHLVLAFAVQALCSAVVSLIPLENSDGAQLSRAARAGTWTVHGRLGFWLSATLKYRVRLRNLPEWMLAEIRGAELHEDSVKYMEGTEIGILLDRDPPDYRAARPLLDKYRARYGDGAWLDYCDAFLLAVDERNPEAAAARMWRGETPLDLEPMQCAAEAAIAAARGDVDAAREWLEAMRAAVRNVTPLPDATFIDLQKRIEALL